MNIYDTKSIYCSRCEKFMGEIDYDGIVILPKCGKCANPLPEENDDKARFAESKYDKIIFSVSQ